MSISNALVAGESIDRNNFPAVEIFAGSSPLPGSYICGTILNALMHDRVLFDMRGWIK